MMENCSNPIRRKRGRSKSLAENRKSKKYRLQRSENVEISWSSDEDEPVVDISTPSVGKSKFRSTFVQCKPVVRAVATNTAQVVSEPSVIKIPIKATSKSSKSSQTIVVRKSSIGLQTVAKQRSETTQTDIRKCFLKTKPKDIKNYEDFALKLSDPELLKPLMQRLIEEKQMGDFFNLLDALASKELPANNIAWKSALYRGKWATCATTTSLKYDREYSEFFAILQLLFGTSSINVLRGPCHFGQVVTENSEKGKYSPSEGKCNFAIPCPKTLAKLDTGYDKVLPCGIIQHTVDMLKDLCKKGKQYVLSCDGKYVGEGCKGERVGDVDLWGREGPPTLDQTLQSKKALLEEVSLLEGVKVPEQQYTIMQRLVTSLSNRMHSLRSRLRGEFFLKKKILDLAQRNPQKAYGYQQSLSRLTVNSADCENLCKRGVVVNRELLQLMGHCNGLSSLIPIGSVSLGNQSNLFQLRPVEDVGKFMDLSDPTNSMCCKQQSKEWFALRKMAPVTGSTIGDAIGLNTLAKQKEHIKTHIFGHKPEPFDDFAKAAMAHGTQYEPKGVATLAGLILPAFKKRCHKFREVGPVFIHGKQRRNLIEVSGDGLIFCESQDKCEYATLVDEHNCIAVEIKSPFPNDNIPLEPYYITPKRHVPQCLAEMNGYDCKELWLISVTKIAVSLIKMYYDEILWNRIFNIIDDLFGHPKITIPSRLHHDVRGVRIAIEKYIQTHCQFVAEVPMLDAVVGIPMEPGCDTEYYATPILEVNEVDMEYVLEQCKVLSAECKLLVEESHRVLRTPAKELVLFMANDKDRLHEEDTPNHLPFAYAMKGKSMSNVDMRHLSGICLNKCKEEGIDLVGSTFDGQFYNFVVYDKDGLPLTKFHLARSTWQKILRFDKEKCLQDLLHCSRVPQGDINVISNANRFPFEDTVLNNVCISRKMRYDIDERKWKPFIRLSSMGGKLYPEGIIENCKIDHDVDTTQYVNPCKRPPRSKTLVGLCPDEENLLSLLDPDVLKEIEEESSNVELGEDELPDIVPIDKMKKALSTSACRLLDQILDELMIFNEKKWHGHMTADLYPGILGSAASICKNMIVKELQIVAKVMEMHTGRVWFSYKLKKLENANIIVSAFDGVTKEDTREIKEKPKVQKESNIYQPKCLKYLCKEMIKTDRFHPLFLQVAYANGVLNMKRCIWQRNAKIPTCAYIPGSATYEREGLWMEHYSLPEYSEERGQPEFRTMDYTHMNTNMRSHILTRGYDFCPTKPFQELCCKRPDILSRALVYDLSDKQNAFAAERMFGAPVEKWMRENGYKEVADFLYTARCWHQACDKRGISADHRIASLYNMYEYLTKDVNFEKFPFPYTGRYVKGVTYQTFDAILQNISVRIQMYDFAKQGCYSSRAVSTLPNESMFSDLVRSDRESNGYLKAVNIGKILGRVVSVNYYKHKPDKSYVLLPTTKGTYPVHLLEHDKQQVESAEKPENQYYKDHHFDKMDQHLALNRVRRQDITTGIAPLRGVLGVRPRFFHVNENRINPETRAGMPITDIVAEIFKANNNNKEY